MNKYISENMLAFLKDSSIPADTREAAWDSFVEETLEFLKEQLEEKFMDDLKKECDESNLKDHFIQSHF